MRLTCRELAGQDSRRGDWNSLGRGAIMYFTIIGDVSSVETIRAELHWYECAGIGKREFKIKRILEGNQT